jgi:hypothetical protein
MKTAIGRDVEMFELLEVIIKSPQQICEMDNYEVNAILDLCMYRLNKLRMGGRSSSLVAMSVVLWSIHDRGCDVKVDVERFLALAFRIAMDPSFVQPEWAVVLAGVMIARYLNRLPEGPKEEVEKQCKRLLCYLEGDEQGNEVVRDAARGLIQSWDKNFPDGLNPVVKACLDGWADRLSVKITDEELEKKMDEMSKSLPANMKDEDRKLYREYLERKGKWQILEGICLK